MSIAARLDLALRTYRATKATECSLATQFHAARAVEKLLGEACDEMPGLGALERSELARVMKLAEIELRGAMEQNTGVSS
jgi:hypothetical protein